MDNVKMKAVAYLPSLTMLISGGKLSLRVESLAMQNITLQCLRKYYGAERENGDKPMVLS